MEMHIIFMDWKTQRGKDVSSLQIDTQFNTIPIKVQYNFLQI